MHERKLQLALSHLINMEIGLFLSDNQFIKGVLLDVKQDHIVVDVNQNIFYFALQHIQVVSNNAKNFRVPAEIVYYVDKNYLMDVLKALRYNWVSINGLSDQAFFGVLSRIYDDHVTLINNAELLYIPKSCIANINSNLSEEQIILLNSQQQLEIQNCQNEVQMISEHIQKTTIEVPILELSAREWSEDETVTSEQLEFHPKTKVEMYTEIVKLLKHNILNRDVDNGLREDIIQKTAIQGFITHIDDESKGQNDSTVIDESAMKGTEFETVTKEYPEVSSQTVSIEVTIPSKLVEHELVEVANEYSPEEDHPGLLDSTNEVSMEEQLFFTESKIKRRKKRLLLTAWSTMNNDQQAMEKHNNFAVENELPDKTENAVKPELPFDRINSLIQPLHDQFPTENFAILEEKPDISETTIYQIPVIYINPKKEKEMLEKQYFALMKHAETNCYSITERQINLTEEEQYLALMKHAAKMYREFRN